LVKDAKDLSNYHNKEKSYTIAEMGDRFTHYTEAGLVEQYTGKHSRGLLSAVFAEIRNITGIAIRALAEERGGADR
jgi:hypothetical protein